MCCRLRALSSTCPASSRRAVYVIDVPAAGARASRRTSRYDENGNRTLPGYEMGPGNRLRSDGVYNYTYDNEGNLLTKTRLSDGQVTEYTWDYRNRLVRVVVKDAAGTVLHEERYTSDVLDRRIGVWEDVDGAGPQGPSQRWTVYDGDNPWADFDGAGSLITRYLYSPAIDQLFARISAAGEVDWYLTDHLGSVRQIVASDGTVRDAITYDSFGQVVRETNPSAGDRFKYTGREWHAALDQYYYRARYYDPGVGRFLGEDPLRFRAGDSNLYRYVGNNPINRIDPSGRLWSWGAVGVGGALGAVGGFFYGVGHETVRVLQGNEWDWGYICKATATGTAGGLATGAVVGFVTGDPTALLAGGVGRGHTGRDCGWRFCCWCNRCSAQSTTQARRRTTDRDHDLPR